MHMATQHGNTAWQQSCSHSTAICNRRFNKRIGLRTRITSSHDAPLIAEYRGGTKRAWKDRSRNRRTPEVPFIFGCSHFTRKTKDFVPRLPQKEAHGISRQRAQCVLQHQLANLHVSAHMATQHGNMPFHCDLPLIAVYCTVMSSITPPFIAFYCSVMSSITPLFLVVFLMSSITPPFIAV